MNPDPAAMRLTNLFLIFVLYALGLAAAVSATKKDAPKVTCKGVTYQQPDGSQVCEPKMNCPRGPR